MLTLGQSLIARIECRPMTFTYERTTDMAAVIAAVKQFCGPDEFVIWRAPFRWQYEPHLESEALDYVADAHGRRVSVLSNAYEGMCAARVCEDRGWELVHDFNHVAVVKGKSP